MNGLPAPRPFRYNPAAGNLLLDVHLRRRAQLRRRPSCGAMLAFNSPTDTVSRVWASGVTALTADSADTIGLSTMIRFSPVPSLRAYTSTAGTPTNLVLLEWNTNPNSFVLQRSTSLGSGAVWQNITSLPGLYSDVLFRRYYFPAGSGRAANFYRLVWPGGH